MFTMNVYNIIYKDAYSVEQEIQLQEQLKKIALNADIPFLQETDSWSTLFFLRREDANKVIYKYNGSSQPVIRAVHTAPKTIKLNGEVVEE